MAVVLLDLGDLRLRALHFDIALVPVQILRVDALVLFSHRRFVFLPEILILHRAQFNLHQLLHRRLDLFWLLLQLHRISDQTRLLALLLKLELLFFLV